MKIIVVGGAPAGIRAALRARELGADVTLLESGRLGGTGFNEGPAPVRALARAARLCGNAAAFSTFGLKGDAPQVDFKAAIASAHRVTAHAHHIRQLMTRVKDAGIEVVDDSGRARFVGHLTLEVEDGRRFEGDRIILAVGGQPRKLPIPGHHLALSFHDLWALEKLPRRVTVVGGAATGCQVASIVLDLGAQVDLVEAADRLIPTSDVDVSRGLRAAFTARGMNIMTATRSDAIEVQNGRLSVVLQRDGNRETLETDAVFLMVGWPANLSSLGLDIAGISTRGPYVLVDQYLQTNVPKIFAVGEANGLSTVVQTVLLQGSLAAENAVLGPKRIYTPRAVASASFTDPEYAAVGLTEAQARVRHDCVVEVVGYDELPRAIIDARTDGMCKLIVDKNTRTLLGAHVLGPYSAEVVQVAATCMAAGMEVTKIAELEFAFPTFTEAIGIAVRRIVHKLGLKAPEWTGNDI